MADESDHQAGIECNRRDFAKASGGAMLLGAAVEPAVADDQRSTDRVRGTVEKVPGLDETFTPSDWLTIGPFQYQRRDVSVDWLFPSGGADDLSTGASAPSAGDSLPSAFAGGSSVEWTRATASGSTVSFPQAASEIDPTGGDLTALFGAGGLFDDFQDWFGIGSVLYGVGYAFTTFEMDAPQRAVLEANAGVWLNGQFYDESPSSVILQEGTNYLLARPYLILGLFGALNLQFRPPEAPVEVNGLSPFRGTPQNVIVPDLVVGEDDTDLPASVRVTNTTGQRIENATLTFAPDGRGDGDLLATQTMEIDPPLAPFETRRVNTRVTFPSDSPSSKGEGQQSPSETAGERAESRTVESTVPSHVMTNSELARRTRRAGAEGEVANALGSGHAKVELTDGAITVAAVVEVDGTDHGRDIPIRVRPEDAERRQSTFTSSHDESVQTFSYRWPTNLDSSSGPWRLIVSLHGANVPSINQAGANNSRENTYVVAPSARGPVNYDHEDLGRLDDLEAMAVMQERFDIDPDQIYLSGHSMGGHGTWHVGLTNPEHFAAIGPSAGWTDHETYITVVWGRDKLHSYPELKAVKETALQKNLAMPKTYNAADGTIPIFVLQGGQDQAVPTMQPRSYMRALANRGLNVRGQVGDRYSTPDPGQVDAAMLEVPGAGHWWDKGIGSGNDGVNHPDMWEYLLASTRDPYPSELSFYTTNLRIEHQKHWVTVLEQETVHQPTKVFAEVTADGIDITTYNVARMSVDTTVLSESSMNAASRVIVNGTPKSLPGNAGTMAGIDLRDGVSVTRGPPAQRPMVKGAEQYGPLKEVHQDPYRLVYGTQGSDAETATNRNLANIRSARLVERARAPATVLPDSAVTQDHLKNYNLVLFGRPSSNSVLEQMRDGFPIRLEDDAVHVRNQTYTGDLGIEFIYPNPQASENLVQVTSGTSLPGLRLTRLRNWIPTQTATPDYQVYDETIRYQKWNANLAAGFFDKHWKLTDKHSVIRDVDH